MFSPLFCVEGAYHDASEHSGQNVMRAHMGVAAPLAACTSLSQHMPHAFGSRLVKVHAAPWPPAGNVHVPLLVYSRVGKHDGPYPVPRGNCLPLSASRPRCSSCPFPVSGETPAADSHRIPPHGEGHFLVLLLSHVRRYLVSSCPSLIAQAVPALLREVPTMRATLLEATRTAAADTIFCASVAGEAAYWPTLPGAYQ
jgi:hypothetical protein